MTTFKLIYLFIYLFIHFIFDLATLRGYEHVTKSRILSLIILWNVKFTIAYISGSSFKHLVASFWVHKKYNTGQRMMNQVMTPFQQSFRKPFMRRAADFAWVSQWNTHTPVDWSWFRNIPFANIMATTSSRLDHTW
jgi:hypothetical protein